MTRDAWIFSWGAVLIAVAGYLALGESPTHWTFQQWMQNVVAIGGILTAKLGTSPLPGRADDAVNLKKVEQTL